MEENDGRNHAENRKRSAEKSLSATELLWLQKE